MKVKLWNLWILTAGIAVGLGFTPIAAAAPTACEVTATGDIDLATGNITEGSLRLMLARALLGDCSDKTITFKVPKVTMNAPLGAGYMVSNANNLKGLVVKPDTNIGQVVIDVKYDAGVVAKEIAGGCGIQAPYNDCFAFLPMSNVTLQNIKVTINPSGQITPLRGLCVGQDVQVKVVDPADESPSHNGVLVDKSEFDGFVNGGVFVAIQSYGVTLTQTLFGDSGDGLIVETGSIDGYSQLTPTAPIMGGSDKAVFALIDPNGAIKEYHLRGLSKMNPTGTSANANVPSLPRVELFERSGKSITKFVQTCSMFMSDPIDGKWNIECVLPNTIKLDYAYAVMVTDGNGSSSMLTTGVIPSSVAKVPMVAPSQKQKPVTPPTHATTDKNPPVAEDKSKAGNSNTNKSLTLTSVPSTGCSLIR